MHGTPQRRRERVMVHEYGCVQCQAWHCQETEPELYAAHLHAQSKHGVRERPATAGEIFLIEMQRG